MDIQLIIKDKVVEAAKALYGETVPDSHITLQPTKKEFEGDLTLVVFQLTKLSKKSPEVTASEIGSYLKDKCDEVSDFNVVKGFLNLVISHNFWNSFFKDIRLNSDFGLRLSDNFSKTFLVEYSSPNTNKPLHLGHMRNILLGHSIAEILKADGNRVFKVNLVNDRGIHICKSMIAWKKYGNGETAQSSGMKGDKLVGKYYVEFDKRYKEEVKELIEQGKTQEEAEKTTPILIEAQELLRKWEAGDSETRQLWQNMNSWVYKGFDETYKKLEVDFEKTYYESETYLLGKKIVEKGLSKGVFFKKDDGSVWIDLTSDGLDQKLLLRSDGTSVYMTQDLGTAVQRVEEFSANNMLYVVGNEQDYHFKVLKLILKKLGYEWAEGIEHISYGMVELPEGKMKSREGTVVDADDLIEEMKTTAAQMTKELGKTDEMTESEANHLFETIGMGALKYFILKVDPKKKMLFNPKESIDFNGHTGPFIQYTYARIQSVLRKAETDITEVHYHDHDLFEKEKELIKQIHYFPEIISEAAEGYSPALIANYLYELAKLYNQFYHELTILKEENKDKKNLRLSLSYTTGNIIRTGMKLLGIHVPERM